MHVQKTNLTFSFYEEAPKITLSVLVFQSVVAVLKYNKVSTKVILLDSVDLNGR